VERRRSLRSTRTPPDRRPAGAFEEIASQGIVGPRPPRGGDVPPWRRRLGRRASFAATAFAFAVAMLGTTLPVPLNLLYRQRFGLSERMATVIYATCASGVIAVLLLFGHLSDQIGRRRVLLAGLVASALSAGCELGRRRLPLLLVGRILSGLSAGAFTGAATATLVDLAPPDRCARTTLVATFANVGGLGCGPLLVRRPVRVAGSPLRLTFWVDLARLVPAAIGIWAMREPVAARGRPRPRLEAPRVPAEMRATFVEALLAGGAGLVVLGLFTAVTPAFLALQLGVSSRAVGAGVAFAVFAASTVGQAALQRVPARIALPAGCLALIAGMGSLALGLALPTLALVVLGGAIAGLGHGLAFRAGLAGVTASAPADRRGEVASSFFVVMSVAISLPVIGVGVPAQAAGLRPAGLAFAGVVTTLSALALVPLWQGRGHEERAEAFERLAA